MPVTTMSSILNVPMAPLTTPKASPTFLAAQTFAVRSIGNEPMSDQQQTLVGPQDGYDDYETVDGDNATSSEQTSRGDSNQQQRPGVVQTLWPIRPWTLAQPTKTNPTPKVTISRWSS